MATVELAMTLDSSGQRGDRNLAAQVVEPAHEALDGLGAIATREVVGTDVPVFGAILEHVIDGGEHGGGDREDDQMGFQKTPVASIATCVTPCSASQSPNFSSAEMVVSKLRTSSCSGSLTQRTRAMTMSLCTSSPAQREYRTCILEPPGSDRSAGCSQGPGSNC